MDPHAFRRIVRDHVLVNGRPPADLARQLAPRDAEQTRRAYLDVARRAP
jgi:integrase